MKRSVLIFFSLSAVLIFSSPAFSEEVSFTRQDRERLVRLEVKLEENYKFLQKQIEDVNKSLQKQIEDVNKSLQRQIDDVNKSLQKQIDDLRMFILWGFGILFGGMGLLIGFVIWDRRTALAPVAKRQKELEEKSEKIERAFKELAKYDSRVAEILKSIGLL